ncbi:MAG TPA: zinc ribbon domain-containing protein [Candidatus Lokiarchaeia archaeon]|nr:zinc ribbon domain-containing protein [Candidatus Lokiarchaeia archaeon]
MGRPMGGPMRRGFYARRMARRIMFGEFLLFGVAGSAMAWSLYPWQLAQIEAYYGMQAEMLNEAQMLQAMQALNIQTAELNAEQQAQMQALDEQEAQAAGAAAVGVPPAAGVAGAKKFCPSCGAPAADAKARFCEQCGHEF